MKATREAWPTRLGKPNKTLGAAKAARSWTAKAAAALLPRPAACRRATFAVRRFLEPKTIFYGF